MSINGNKILCWHVQTSRGMWRVWGESREVAEQQARNHGLLVKRITPAPPVVDAGPSFCCPQCGPMSCDWVAQAVRDEMCVYICRECGEVVEQLS